VDLAQHDILQGVGPGSETSEPHVWADYERLVSVARNDLESLEYNIYHSTVTEIKKRLNVMIVPALIESQTLPGFVTQETSGRLLNRFITQPEKVPLYGMEELLELMNKVMKAMKSYHIHDDVISQVFISDLLKLIGVNSFNDMLMRRNFCSWKRGMLIETIMYALRFY
jgi:myosin-5